MLICVHPRESAATNLTATANRINVSPVQPDKYSSQEAQPKFGLSVNFI